MIEEIQEVERNYAHMDVRLAKEKFKMFAFRWSILNKVQKLRKLDRESYDFTKASLEVQELVKVDTDFRIEAATKALKAKLEDFRQDRYQLLSDYSTLRF